MTFRADPTVSTTRQTQLFEFPGGVLELQSTGDDLEDRSGFYLEIGGHGVFDGHDDGRVVMRYKPTCLGYLRTDVSGIGQLWDETQIRRLAERYGYDLAEVVVYDPTSTRPPLARLKAQATRLSAEAVIIPTPAHLPAAQIPPSLLQRLAIITIHPEATHPRHTTPPSSRGT